MGPSTEDVFCLDVFVQDVNLLPDDIDYGDGNGIALACRFLDYPLFFIHPQGTHDRYPRCKFNTGKSCALAESREKLAGIISKIPLYILLVNFNKRSQPQLLGAGAAKLRIDRPGSSTPGEQHLVALHDPFGVPVAHARIQVQLSDHGASMHPHLLQPSRSGHCKSNMQTARDHGIQHSRAQAHTRARGLRALSINVDSAQELVDTHNSLHVHCHVASPSPARCSASPHRRRKSPSRQPSKPARKPAKPRPMSTPRPQHTVQPSPGIHRIYPLSAPSTPAHPHPAAGRRRAQPSTATAATQCPADRHSSKHSSDLHRASDASRPSKQPHRVSRSGRSVASSRKIKVAKRHGVAAQLYQQRLEQQTKQQAHLPATSKSLHQQAQHEAPMACPDVEQRQACPTHGQRPPREQPEHGLGPLGTCTVCSGPHHFKQAGVQDITSVACEMMTLVSMRAAMSQVMDGLVHQWQSGMSHALPVHLPTATAAAAAAPCSPPAASRHSSMPDAAAVPSTPQAYHGTPTAAVHAASPSPTQLPAGLCAGPARSTADGVLQGGTARSGVQPLAEAEVCARRHTAPLPLAMRTCESPSEVVVVEAASSYDAATAAACCGGHVQRKSPDRSLHLSAATAAEALHNRAALAAAGKHASHLGVVEAQESAQRSTYGSGCGTPSALDECVSGERAEGLADEGPGWGVGRHGEEHRLGEVACMDVATEPGLGLMAEEAVTWTGKALRGSGHGHDDSVKQDAKRRVASSIPIGAQRLGGNDALRSSQGARALLDPAEGTAAWSERSLDDSTVQVRRGNATCRRARSGGQCTRQSVQAADALEQRLEEPSGRLESIRTEISGAATEAARAPARQASSSGETSYTIASESGFSSVTSGTTAGNARSAAALRAGPASRSEATRARSAVSMSGSSLSGSILSDDSVSIAGSESSANSQPTVTDPGPLRAATPHLRPGAGLAAQAGSSVSPQQSQVGAATPMGDVRSRVTRRAAQPPATGLSPLPPKAHNAVTTPAASSPGDSSSEYDSVIDGSDASIVSSSVATRTADSGKPGGKSGMFSAKSTTSSESELGVSALDSSSEDGDDGFSRFSKDSEAIAAAAHAFGRPPEALPGADGSGLLGLQMLDAYARAGLDGGDLYTGGAMRDDSAGSARTSDIDRSLDGDSSSSSSYHGGATTGAASSYTATSNDSGSDGGFSDEEW